MRKLTNAEFIEKANKVHNNEYLYDRCEYNGTDSNIVVTCKLHGDFNISRAQDHIRSYSQKKCPICMKQNNDERLLSNFLKSAKEVHGDKYSYTNVKYKSRTRISITCNKHGDFLQLPNIHLLGSGCPKCAVESRSYNFDSFCEKAKSIHGDRYDYSLVKVTGADKRIKIVCPEHGVFSQFLCAHVSGSGCKKCSYKNQNYDFLEKYTQNPEIGNKSGVLYLLRFSNGNESFLKVGITCRYKKRMQFMKRQVHYQIEELALFNMTNYETALVERNILLWINENGMNYIPLIDFDGKSECCSEEYLEPLLEKLTEECAQYLKATGQEK